MNIDQYIRKYRQVANLQYQFMYIGSVSSYYQV